MENLLDIFKNIKITQQAIDHLYKNWDPVSYSDFTGYLVDLGVLYPKMIKQKLFCAAISWDNQLAIFPFKKGKRKLTDKKLLEILSILSETQFIEPRITTPFEEYQEPIPELPLNLERIHMIESPLLVEKGSKKCQ